MEYFVRTKIDNSILEIEFFNRKANSFNSEMLRTLTEIIVNSGTNTEVKAIVLRSEGKVFSSGASFDEMLGITDPLEAKEFFMGFAKLINAMIKCPKFIITIVHGKAIGGSVGIVSASDYAVCSVAAEFRLSEYSVGIGPFVIAPVIERKIGLSGLMEMTIDTEYRSADWAISKGLCAAKADTNEIAYDLACKLAGKIAERNPDAVNELKTIFWEKERANSALFEERAERSARLLLTEFTKNYLREFKK